MPDLKTLQEIIKRLEENREDLHGKFKIKRIRMFGSYARGEQKETSDVDLIVEFEEVPTFFELVRIQEELEKLLGVNVDLLTPGSISPFIRPYITEFVEI